MYVKTKELGPIGGVRRARPLDPPMIYMNPSSLNILISVEMHNRLNITKIIQMKLPSFNCIAFLPFTPWPFYKQNEKCHRSVEH